MHTALRWTVLAVGFSVLFVIGCKKKAPSASDQQAMTQTAEQQLPGAKEVMAALDKKDYDEAVAALARDGRQPLNHFALTLAADELASLRDRLLEHEVEIVEEAKPRWGAQGNEPSMKVLDPDGNIVELKAPPTPVA